MLAPRALRFLLAAAVPLGTLTAFLGGCGTETSTFLEEEEDQNSSGGGSSSGQSLPSGETDGGPVGNGNLAACASAVAETGRQPVYLNIVLDGSGSMDGMKPTTNQPNTPGGLCVRNDPGLIDGCEECTCSRSACWMTGKRDVDPLFPERMTGRRWIAARGALRAYFEAEAAAQNPELAVGMHVFQVADGPILAEPSPMCSPSIQKNVPIGYVDDDHVQELWTAIAPQVWPDGSTPLRASIAAQKQVLLNYSPSLPVKSGGKRVLLVITDGVPKGPGESENAVMLEVQNALGQDVFTAVIGVGDPEQETEEIYNESFLSRLAQAGGVAPEGCDPSWTVDKNTQPCHLQVTPGQKTATQIQQDITSAIQEIGVAVASCELTLERTSPIDPEQVNVLYTNGAGEQTQIEQGMPDGWTYDNPSDPTKVILHGESCAQLKGDRQGKVEIVIGCPTGTSVVVN